MAIEKVHAKNATVSQTGKFRSTQSGSSAVSLSDIWRFLCRRKWIIISTITIVMTMVSYIVFMHLSPLYTASASVMIESRDYNVVEDAEAVLPRLTADMAAIQTEVEVLHSRDLIKGVIRDLKLFELYRFEANTENKGGTWGFLEELLPQDWPAFLWRLRPPSKPLSKVEFIENFIESLDVRQKEQSRVLQIRFTSPDAETAALIVNTLVESYIQAQIDAKILATNQANQWLNEQIIYLNDQVKQSEQAVESFRKESDLLRAKETSLIEQQVSELNTQLILNQAKMAEAEARVAQVESIRDSNQLSSIAEVAESPIFQQLFATESELVRKLAEYSEEYGSRHPVMINLRSEISEIRKRISREVDKTNQIIRNEARAAGIRDRVIQNKLNEYRNRLNEANAAEVSLRALDREAEANRDLSASFLKRLKETSLQLNFQGADATIISRADPPISPSFPRSWLILFVSFVGSACFGVVAAFVVEYYDPTLNRVEDVREYLDAKPLGLIPVLQGMRNGKGIPTSEAFQKNNSFFKEALANLHTNLLIFDGDRVPKSILITSSLPGEGKTMLACSFARYLAITGEKVVLIDCDFRHPEVHEQFAMQVTPGLVNHLCGEVSLDEVTFKDAETNLKIIPSGKEKSGNYSVNVSDVHGISELLFLMKRDFDFVILDAPPVLAVSYVKMIAREADSTVFVAHWGATARATIREGLKLITECSDTDIGVLLNKVDTKKHSHIGLYGSIYYNKKLKNYYTPV